MGLKLAYSTIFQRIYRRTLIFKQVRRTFVVGKNNQRRLKQFTSMSTFKEKLGNFGREIFLFLSSKIFLKNLAGMIGLIALLLLVSFFWMGSYTHHGESLQVPSFLNLNIDEAVNQANNENLKVVVNDSIWTADKPTGTVIEQSPKPLSKVKEERTIYLTITKFQAEEKLLPTLAGNDNYNYYARRLKQLKVKGVKVPQGAMVEAVVTTRGGARVTVPNLICKKYSEAEFLIGGSQLSISVIKDGTVQSLDDAYVWKQSPTSSGGRTLGVGSTIDVYVTKRPPANCN